MKLIALLPLVVGVRGLTWLRYQYHATAEGGLRPPRRQRFLKPRTPADCPACCPQEALPPCATRPWPWAEMRSRRGRPKRIVTQGFGCPEPR